MSDPNSMYDYNPSKPLPLVCMAVFALAMLVTIYRTQRHKCWRYLWPWILGGSFETIGYISRYVSADNVDEVGPYAVSQTLIIVAPALLAATMYMSFGRLVSFVDGGRSSPIQAHRVTKVFVVFDVISFLVQATGGSLYADVNNNPSIANTAKAIVMVGLATQLVAFSIFLIFSFVYKRRIDREGLNYEGGNKLLMLLWIVGVLILIRSIFRMVEFGTANQTSNEETSFIMTHEVMFYVFECLPMIIVCIIWCIFPPSLWLPVDRTESLHGLPTTTKVKKEKPHWWNRTKQDFETVNTTTNSSIELESQGNYQLERQLTRNNM